MFIAASVAPPLVKAGKVKALAVTTAQPTPLAPDLPTVAATLPGYEAVAIVGVYAPAKTPSSLINRLNQEIVRGLNQPQIKERLFNTGVEVVGSTPEGLAATIQSEMAKWGKMVKELGIRGE
jgi:tripartite-type tricarboxylate transporter receptor subunit TctC